MSNAWFPSASANGRGATAVLCFPSAGGDAPLYRDWQGALGSEVEVLPASLPGRGRRIAEALLPSIEDMAGAVLEPAIEAIASRPAVLFGHSMGALIAFELAHHLVARDVTPTLLVVSGAAAPRRVAAEAGRYDGMSDQDVLAFVRSLGLTPDEIFEYPDLQEMLLPVLRNDIEASGRYTVPPRASLPVPLLVLEGSDDPLVDPAELTAWEQHTSRGARLVVIEGGHSFLADRRELVLDAIRESMREHAADAPGTRAGLR